MHWCIAQIERRRWIERERSLARTRSCGKVRTALTETEDSKNVQIGIATSVIIHAVLLFVFAWFLGLDQAARELWRQAHAVVEEPQVTLLFPDQVLPSPKLKPKLEKQYIRTTQNEAEPNKPASPDFISDRSTKAASKEAPFPDGTAPMPTTKGIDQPTNELANRKYQDGKPADDNAGKPPAPMVVAPPLPPPPAPAAPPIAPLVPDEPKQMPQQVAKAEPTPMAKLMQQVDRQDDKGDTSRLQIDVRKPTDEPMPTPSPPKVEPPKESAAVPTPSTEPPQKRAMDNFSPFTETAKVKGTISNKGENAVNAEDTPLGRFTRAVNAAVEKKWHYYRLRNRGSVSYGYLKVRFFVNREGKAEDIQFVEKANNPLMEDFTLEAILKADIPPIPKELLPMLDNDRFPVEYDILIHD